MAKAEGRHWAKPSDTGLTLVEDKCGNLERVLAMCWEYCVNNMPQTQREGRGLARPRLCFNVVTSERCDALARIGSNENMFTQHYPLFTVP